MKNKLHRVLTLTFGMLAYGMTTHAQVLKIQSGATLFNASTITLQNVSLVNDGELKTASGSGTLQLTGTDQQTVSGSGTTSLYHVVSDKPNGAKTLFQQNVSVGGNITLTNGIIDLTNTTMTLLPPAAIQNETETAYITASGTGELVMTMGINNVNGFRPGNMGLLITTQNNLGETVFRRGHYPQTDNNSNSGIKRWYSVEPANNSGLYVYLQLNYLDAELNNINEAGLGVFKKQGATPWTAVQLTGTSNVLNFRDFTGETSLDRYTFFPTSPVDLPLRLLAFAVNCKDGGAALQWITENEVATARFLVEQSTDGTAWRAVQTIAAAGNSTPHTYSATAAASGATYYRLKMEDRDGTFTYSPVKRIQCGVKNTITVGPNPTSGTLNISFQLEKKDNGTIQLLDAKGALLQNKNFNVSQGLNVETLDLHTYPSGTYLLNITTAGGLRETRQVIKR